MTDPLRKPEGLNWTAASVELPEIPMLPAGQDALSATISAVLPTSAAPLAANVATLQAKETMFSGKLGAAQAAYQNSDDAGSQSVGQVVGTLGQLGQQAGQMGQSAGAPAQAIGGQTGMFSQLMQQAMQAAHGGGGGGASPAERAAASAAPGTASGPVAGGQPQQPRGDAFGATDGRAEQRHEPRHRERELLQHAEAGASGPVGSGHDPAPVKPPEHQTHRGDEDLGRRL